MNNELKYISTEAVEYLNKMASDDKFNMYIELCDKLENKIIDESYDIPVDEKEECHTCLAFLRDLRALKIDMDTLSKTTKYEGQEYEK
jgi:hypothetical protein